MHFALCTLHFAFCILHFAFCILHFAFCILHFALCILHCAFCILHSALLPRGLPGSLHLRSSRASWEPDGATKTPSSSIGTTRYPCITSPTWTTRLSITAAAPAPSRNTARAPLLRNAANAGSAAGSPAPAWRPGPSSLLRPASAWPAARAWRTDRIGPPSRPGASARPASPSGAFGAAAAGGAEVATAGARNGLDGSPFCGPAAIFCGAVAFFVAPPPWAAVGLLFCEPVPPPVVLPAGPTPLRTARSAPPPGPRPARRSGPPVAA